MSIFEIIGIALVVVVTLCSILLLYIWQKKLKKTFPKEKLKKQYWYAFSISLLILIIGIILVFVSVITENRMLSYFGPSLFGGGLCAVVYNLIGAYRQDL